MAKFENTSEYWAAEINAAEKRLSRLLDQYDKNHMRQDWDFCRALDEIGLCHDEIESLYDKLDDAHRMESGIYGVAA